MWPRIWSSGRKPARRMVAIVSVVLLALGMRRTALASMFLVEGAVVGALGGIAGAAGGMGAALAYAANEGWVPVIPADAALWGIAAGLLSGTLSAVYPAVVASRANPAQLIRS